MKKYKSFVLLLILPFLGCNKDNIENDDIYFPANNGLKWEIKTIASLKWNEGAVADLKNYLIQTNTKSFMILHNGRILEFGTFQKKGEKFCFFPFFMDFCI
jgi:hypothetical protein